MHHNQDLRAPWQLAEPAILRRARPVAVWLQGSVPAVDPPRVAVVGTRKADAETLARTRALARVLVQAGAVVATGGAKGVDTAALQGALDAGGAPLVALAGGLNHWSPPCNRALFEQVLLRGGTLISEQPPEAMPLLARFHARNRLLVRAVDAVIVVAGELQGGTTSTVRAAWRQLPLFVPVPAFSAAGCVLPDTLAGLGALPLLAADPEVWAKWLALLRSEPLRAWQPPPRWLPQWPATDDQRTGGGLFCTPESGSDVDEPAGRSPCYAPRPGDRGDAPNLWAQVLANTTPDGAVLTERLLAVLTEVAPEALTAEELACALQTSRNLVAPLVLQLTLAGLVETLGGGRVCVLPARLPAGQPLQRECEPDDARQGPGNR